MLAESAPTDAEPDRRLLDPGTRVRDAEPTTSGKRPGTATGGRAPGDGTGPRPGAAPRPRLPGCTPALTKDGRCRHRDGRPRWSLSPGLGRVWGRRLDAGPPCVGTRPALCSRPWPRTSALHFVKEAARVPGGGLSFMIGHHIHKPVVLQVWLEARSTKTRNDCHYLNAHPANQKVTVAGSAATLGSKH